MIASTTTTSPTDTVVFKGDGSTAADTVLSEDFSLDVTSTTTTPASPFKKLFTCCLPSSDQHADDEDEHQRHHGTFVLSLTRLVMAMLIVGKPKPSMRLSYSLPHHRGRENVTRKHSVEGKATVIGLYGSGGHDFGSLEVVAFAINLISPIRVAMFVFLFILFLTFVHG